MYQHGVWCMFCVCMCVCVTHPSHTIYYTTARIREPYEFCRIALLPLTIFSQLLLGWRGSRKRFNDVQLVYDCMWKCV